MNTKLFLAVFALVMLSVNSMRLHNHEGRYAWFTFDEASTGNKCSGPLQCDGQRTCSRAKVCGGTARPPKNANYSYNEFLTNWKCPATP